MIEGAKAHLVEAQILRQQGDYDRALSLSQECAAVFREFRDSQALVVARITEACVLFAAKRFREALQIFSELAADASARGDKPTLARTLHNAAECARELGDIPASRDLHRRALAHFVALGLTTEIARVRWGYALATEAEGKNAEAILELYSTRAEYLSLGKIIAAASVGLDIVRIKTLLGEEVSDRVAELIETFTASGMTPNALEALAYLRGEARRDAVTLPKIQRVRRYFDELARSPTLVFARPREEEDDGRVGR